VSEKSGAAPIKPGETTKVERKEIKSIEASKVSPMPAGLLNQLREDEILNLPAYVLSGGKSGNRMFNSIPLGRPRGNSKAQGRLVK